MAKEKEPRRPVNWKQELRLGRKGRIACATALQAIPPCAAL